MPAKIVIVDDHSIVREGLKQLLELDGDVEVIGEASDGVECLNLLKKIVPQVLLLDINMPNMNGLEVLERLKENNVDVKVVILTVHNENKNIFLVRVFKDYLIISLVESVQKQEKGVTKCI